MRFTESSVRAAIFASLEGNLNQVLTLYVGEKLAVTTIAETLRQLDIRLQHLTQHEDKFAVKQFVESERRQDESLQSWVDRYRSLYQRAATSGYVPSSDLADTVTAPSGPIPIGYRGASVSAHGGYPIPTHMHMFGEV